MLAPIIGLNGHGPIAGHPLYIEQPMISGKDWRDPDIQMTWTLNGRTLPGPMVALPLPDGQGGIVTPSYTIAGQTFLLPAIPVQAFARKPIFVDTAHGIDGPNRGMSTTSPLKSIPKIAGDSHVGLYFNADAPQDIDSTILLNGCQDIWIGRYGAAKQATFHIHCMDAFTCDANTADVTWVNAVFSGDLAVNGASVGIPGGRSFAMSNIGVSGIDNAFFDAPYGMLGLFMDTVSVQELPQYTLFLGSTAKLILLNPDFAGSQSQIPVRITGSSAAAIPATDGSGLVGGLLYNGTIKQKNTFHKAALDFRKALHVLIQDIGVANGNSSANSEGNYPTEVSDLLYINHQLTMCKLELHEGSHNIRVRGGHSQNPGSECYSFQNFRRRTNGTMAHALEDVRVDGVRGFGLPGNSPHCLGKYYGATSAQASVGNSELDASAGTPLFKDASGNPVNAGPNNKLVAV